MTEENEASPSGSTDRKGFFGCIGFSWRKDEQNAEVARLRRTIDLPPKTELYPELQSEHTCDGSCHLQVGRPGRKVFFHFSGQGVKRK